MNTENLVHLYKGVLHHAYHLNALIWQYIYSHETTVVVLCAHYFLFWFFWDSFAMQCRLNSTSLCIPIILNLRVSCLFLSARSTPSHLAGNFFNIGIGNHALRLGFWTVEWQLLKCQCVCVCVCVGGVITSIARHC